MATAQAETTKAETPQQQTLIESTQETPTASKLREQWHVYRSNFKARNNGTYDGALDYKEWKRYEARRQVALEVKSKQEAEKERENIVVDHGDLLSPPKDQAKMWQWMKSLEKKLWESELFAYLYRMGPITDRKATDRENCVYIAKYSEPPEVERIMEHHGSGLYKLMLNHYSHATGKTLSLVIFTFRILNESYPPVVPIGEWVDDPRNKDWQWAKQAMLLKAAKQDKEFNKEMQATQGTAQAPTAPNALTDLANAVKMLAPQGNDALNQHLTRELEAARSDTKPNAALQMVKEIAALVKPNEDSGLKATLEMVKGIMEGTRAEMVELRTQNNSLMLELVTLAKTPPTSPTKARSLREELIEFKELAEMLSPKATTADDWTAVAMKGLDTLAQYAPMLISAATKTPDAAQPPPTAANGTRRAPQAQQTAQAAPQTEEEQRQMLREQINAQFGPLLDRIAPTLSAHFHQGTGNTLQDWFKKEYGLQTYAVLMQFSPQTVLDVLNMRKEPSAGAPPEVQALLIGLTPTDKLPAFVTDFLDDTEPDDAPPAKETAAPQEAAAAVTMPPPPPAVEAAQPPPAARQAKKKVNGAATQAAETF